MASLSHRQGWSLAVLLAIFPCLLCARAENDAPKITYRTGTSEVRVTFFATDQNNHLVQPIDRNDFAVVDGDMIVRDFRSLTRSDETRLDIVVLVDASESVAPRFHAIAEQVLRLISHKHAGDDLSIITFAGLRPALLCTADCSRANTENKIRSLTPAGATPLFDSLAFSGRYIADRHTPGVRQVLILLSDGNDTISGTSARQAMDSVIGTGALLYTVNSNKPAHDVKGSFVLAEMAEATGGRSFSAQEDAADVLETALADLRASYVVTYPLPSQTAGFHSLRILPKHNLNLRFHCRRGYFYDEGR
ncbi:MAG: VWA domain-containing protein [Acidobacteriia bacterium]|nr:VWA domain-containing protein [Terriglobia bacterium]